MGQIIPIAKRRTTQQFIDRVNEHLHTDTNSAIYKHLRENENCIISDHDSHSIFDNARTEFLLRVKEALNIQKMLE